MTIRINAARLRNALTELPEGTNYGGKTALTEVYLPSSHRKAVDPNNMLVTGMRGAGKTFWWSALQQSEIRDLVYQISPFSALNECTEVRTGFGVRPAPDEYPDTEVLKQLLRSGREPKGIWHTVQAWQLARYDHPIRRLETWSDRWDYVEREPEKIARLFLDRDAELDNEGVYLLLLFDGLDRCSDDWRDMYRLIRGLMQTALDMRSYRRLRVKIFLRSDQLDETRVGDFADASKILSSSVELSWPISELYGLLWHSLVNMQAVRQELTNLIPEDDYKLIQVGNKKTFLISRRLIVKSEEQRDLFHCITGPFMGTNRRRGFPYTWIPSHLSDTAGRVSPRPFLRALQAAADDTAHCYPEHEYALHYESIKRGVQVASKTRVAEIREDYPWVDLVLSCLRGMTVPCRFEEIDARWNEVGVLDQVKVDSDKGFMRFSARNFDKKALGIRLQLEELGVFLPIQGGRVNIPDVFRVGYGLGRKGGVNLAH